MQQIKFNYTKLLQMLRKKNYLRSKILEYIMERLENNQIDENSNLPNFIVSVNNGWAKMSLRHANCILGTKSNFYRMVKEEGFYLPSEESRCITTQYLFSVVSGSVFRILRKDVVYYTTIKSKWSKIDLLSWLESSGRLALPLGITVDKLPDFNWLANVVHSLCPNHDMFCDVETGEKLVDIPLW